MQNLCNAEHFCAMCGHEVSVLLDGTGWCAKCSGYIERKCIKCGSKFFSKTEDYYCLDCKQVLANEIETLMVVERLSFTRAQIAINDKNRPSCLCCGDALKHATPGRHKLCEKRPGCRKVKRRTKYYRFTLGMEKEEAFEKALALHFKDLAKMEDD